MATPKILITGASGLLGSNLVNEATQHGQVIGITHGYRGPLPGAKQVSCDLMDAQATTQLLDHERPEWIFHCAALTQVDRCEQEPELARKMNVQTSEHLASWASSHGTRFVYVSTDGVFDGQRGSYTEEDAPAPLNVYARTKLEGENVVAQRCPHAVIVRTNMFGWNLQKKQSLSEWFLAKLKEGSPIQGFRDVRFNPLLVNDLANYLVRLVLLGATGIFNLGSSDQCSKYEFGQALGKTFGLSLSGLKEASVDEASMKAPRPKNTTLSVSKAAALFKEMLPTVQQGLDRFKALKASH